MYSETMRTQSEFEHNFRILKLVRMLTYLRVIDWNEWDAHVEFLDNRRPIGLEVDYLLFRVRGSGNDWFML